MERRIYNFKVTVLETGRITIYRKIQLRGATSLYHFAQAIVKSFGFYFDHYFAFNDNVDEKFSSYDEYTLFKDDGDPVKPNEKSVKFNYIHKVFYPTKKIRFLFDYGDNWEFLVECLGISEPQPGKKYPMVTVRYGQAPPQYPPCEDDDDE